MHIGKYIAGLTLVGIVGLIVLNPQGFTKTLTVFVGAINNGLRVASGRAG